MCRTCVGITEFEMRQCEEACMRLVPDWRVNPRIRDAAVLSRE